MSANIKTCHRRRRDGSSRFRKLSRSVKRDRTTDIFITCILTTVKIYSYLSKLFSHRINLIQTLSLPSTPHHYSTITDSSSFATFANYSNIQKKIANISTTIRKQFSPQYPLLIAKSHRPISSHSSRKNMTSVPFEKYAALPQPWSRLR